MATATSRRAGPSKKLLELRRTTAQARLDLEHKLAPDYAKLADFDTQLKKFATDAGEAFKEDFGARGYVSASGAVAAEFKGEVPQIVTEAWLKLKPAEQKALIKSGVVKLERQFGKASNGRVTVKAP